MFYCHDTALCWWGWFGMLNANSTISDDIWTKTDKSGSVSGSTHWACKQNKVLFVSFVEPMHYLITQVQKTTFSGDITINASRLVLTSGSTFWHCKQRMALALGWVYTPKVVYWNKNKMLPAPAVKQEWIESAHRPHHRYGTNNLMFMYKNKKRLSTWIKLFFQKRKTLHIVSSFQIHKPVCSAAELLFSLSSSFCA